MQAYLPIAGASPRMTEAEITNALARFKCMRSRAYDLGFAPMAPRVDASTPEQMRDATENVLRQATEEQEAS